MSYFRSSVYMIKDNSVLLKCHYTMLLDEACKPEMKRKLQLGCIIVSGIFILTVGLNFVYLFNEFIINNHFRDHDEVYSSWSQLDHEIPKIIHQVMFNTSIPKRFLEARRKCQQVNRGFKFILWNKTMVDQLVEDYYPFLRDLFYRYKVWVNRADVARYLIVHYHGGIYIDMDTECTGR